MAEVRWKLADYLEEHGITAYRLAKAVGARTRAGTIYRLSRKGKEPRRVDLPTLATVLEGLRRITGEEVGLGDIFEFVPGLEPEGHSWLEANAGSMGEHLAELEAEVPPEELRGWLEAFEVAVEPLEGEGS